MLSIKNGLMIGVMLLVIAGCSSGANGASATDSNGATAAQSTPPSDNSTTTTSTAATTTPDTNTMSSTTQTTNDNAGDPPKTGDDVAVITTNYGTIVFKFFPDKAPKSVANFKKLADSKFYDGTKFHRVIPRFMIQGGDPNTKGSDRNTYGTGGPGWSVDAEFSDIKHVRGIVSMARSSDPNSAGSQFFIMVAPYPSLDGQYSAFGHVVSGMDTVDKIVSLERDDRDDPVIGKEAVMKTVRIEKWPVKG